MRMAKQIRTLLIALPACAICAGFLPAEVSEYQMKAVFLYSFAKFVEWPEGALKSSATPVTACILGESPFGDEIASVKGKPLENRVFNVRTVSAVPAAADCQMLFISSSERKRLPAILSQIKASPILTVGDWDGFAEGGGMINLKLEGGRIRLQINVEATQPSGLKLSAKLLGLAQIVNGKR